MSWIKWVFLVASIILCGGTCVNAVLWLRIMLDPSSTDLDHVSISMSLAIAAGCWLGITLSTVGKFSP